MIGATTPSPPEQRPPAKSRKSASCRGLGAGLLALTWIAAASCATTQPSSGANALSPSHVAVAYTEDLFSGKFSAASKLVEPVNEQQQLFKLLIDNITKQSVAYIGHLRSGATHLHGNHGSVVIIGTLCSTGNRSSVAAQRSHRSLCQSNSAPNTTNPGFLVGVVRRYGRWYVQYNTSSPAHTTQPAG